MRNEHEATEGSIVPIISDQIYALNTHGVKWKNIFMIKLYEIFYNFCFLWKDFGCGNRDWTFTSVFPTPPFRLETCGYWITFGVLSSAYNKP